MTRKCPHCKAKVGQLANTCWKCKKPLGPSKTSSAESGEVSKKEPKKGLNIWVMIIATAVVFVIIAAFLLFFMEPEKQPGIEIKVFYDGEWEGSIWLAGIENVNGSGDKTFHYPIPDPAPLFISANFHKADGGDGTLRLEIWVNGELKDHKVNDVKCINSDAPIVIGKGVVFSKETRFFNGKVDELRIYNKAFTDDEIELLYKYDFSELSPNIIKKVRKIFLFPDVNERIDNLTWNPPNNSRIL